MSLLCPSQLGMSTSSTPNSQNRLLRHLLGPLCSLTPLTIFPRKKNPNAFRVSVLNQEVVRLRGENDKGLGSNPDSNIRQLRPCGGITSPSTLPLVWKAEIIITTSKGCCEDQVRSLACSRCSRNKSPKPNHLQTV